MNQDERFFYEHAAFSYNPSTQTKEQGRETTARRLAMAEQKARHEGMSFDWCVDTEIDSSDFSDESPPWELWLCLAYDAKGAIVATMGAVDFGRDVFPHSHHYRRVVEAELALEALS